MRLGLALHVVIIVCTAPCSNEERRAEQRSGRGADFRNLGYGIGQGRGVDEDILVEPMGGEISFW